MQVIMEDVLRLKGIKNELRLFIVHTNHSPLYRTTSCALLCTAQHHILKPYQEVFGDSYLA